MLNISLSLSPPRTIESEHLRTPVSSESPTQVAGILTREEGASDQPTMAEKNETTQNCNGAYDHESESESENENTHIDQETDEEDESTPVEMKLKNKAALLGLRCKVEDAIRGNYLMGKPCKNLLSKEREKYSREQLRDITLWGVPLLPTKGHAGTDDVLLKFLRAKDFKVLDAFEMLQKTLRWRREYQTDMILEETMGSYLENIVCLKSRDREGRHVCYVTYGAFKDREFYRKAYGTEEKCNEYVRWRVQFMEKCIAKMSFQSGGVNSILQISDLNNSPRHKLKELRSARKKTMVLLQDNYPELIHKIIIINVPFWYRASHLLLSRFFSQRMKKKFVFAKPSQVTKTLLKFIAPENLPVEYGGLMRENDADFTPAEKASELIIRGNSNGFIEFPVTEAGVTMVWDITVVGWDVSFKEQFIPNDEGSYKILIQNQKKMGGSFRNSFYICETGRIIITIHNEAFKKKRVLYRSKAKPTVPIYQSPCAV